MELKKKSKIIEDLHDLIRGNRISEKKGQIIPNIKSYNNIENEITLMKNNLLENIGSINNKDLKQKAENVINKIDHDLEDLKKKISRKIQDLEIKNRELSSLENESNSNSNLKYEDNIMDQIKVNKLESNAHFLENRKKDLLNIQQIAAQVNHLTKEMNENVQKQGEMLDSIEENIQETDKNVEKGLKDIKEISENQKKNKKTICCIVWMILLVVFTLCGIIFALFQNKIFQK